MTDTTPLLPDAHGLAKDELVFARGKGALTWAGEGARLAGSRLSEESYFA